MSHLQHINAYKLDLIKAGITHPEDQMGLARTAYTCAFIRFFTSNCIHEAQYKPVMEYMLGYWNETFPVNGPFVMGSVKSFYSRLYSALSQVKGEVEIAISKEKVVEDHPKYITLDSYEDLVKTLVMEIEHKYAQIKGV